MSSKTISLLRGLQKGLLCSLLILSASASSPFSFQWCFMPRLQPRLSGSYTAPPLSCRPVATSRLLVLTTEKSASTTIGKWSQRKAAQQVAIRLTVTQGINLIIPGNAILWVWASPDGALVLNIKCKSARPALPGELSSWGY